MDIFIVASFIGTIGFAFSGILIGVQNKMDVMGVFILAMLTANGGGAIRDVLVNQTPMVLTDLSGFYIVFGVFVLAYIFRLYRFADIEKHYLFVISDAIGLVAFSVTGALIAIDAGLNGFGVMVLSFITAAGGGIIRDLLVNKVPTILSSDVYGSIAVLLGIGIYALNQFNMDNSINIMLLMSFCLVLRLLAYHYQWKLPYLK